MQVNVPVSTQCQQITLLSHIYTVKDEQPSSAFDDGSVDRRQMP